MCASHVLRYAALLLEQIWDLGSLSVVRCDTRLLTASVANLRIQAIVSIMHMHYERWHRAVSRRLHSSFWTRRNSRTKADHGLTVVMDDPALRRQFLAMCTPEQCNYEANPERERFALLNELYGGRPIAYFNILRSLRKSDELQGARLGIDAGSTDPSRRRRADES
jgi:hypothetical protein